MERKILASRQNIVLLFVKPQFHSHRERISGVYSAAIERGWLIQQISEIPTGERIAECIRLWNPIGCLVDPSVMTSKLDARVFRQLTTVLMGRGDAQLPWERFNCSFLDCRKPAEKAFETLKDLTPGSFAFVGDPALPYWSIERGQLFKAIVPKNASFSEYTIPDPNTLRGRKTMVKWIRSLPLPCGCFLAADHLAAPFYAAAYETGLKIGTDLPTIGLDNDERICQSLTPSLTSIQIDFFQSGVDGIRLLEKRLSNPDSPPAIATYGVLGVVRRASTATTYKDGRVTKAMLAITERGCEKISVGDIADVMGCSSRLAEKLFRLHTGISILDAIRKVRLEKAYTLLRNRAVPIDAIPFQCGYAASPAYLKTYFRRTTGLTMREWRKQNLN